MTVEIITKEDLQSFRMQLLNDILQVMNTFKKEKTEWLKNSEVMELLKVSSNTVQRLRIAGKLKSTKVGGVHYYQYEDICHLLDNGI